MTALDRRAVARAIVRASDRYAVAILGRSVGYGATRVQRVARMVARRIARPAS